MRPPRSMFAALTLLGLAGAEMLPPVPAGSRTPTPKPPAPAPVSEDSRQQRRARFFRDAMADVNSHNLRREDGAARGMIRSERRKLARAYAKGAQLRSANPFGMVESAVLDLIAMKEPA